MTKERIIPLTAGRNIALVDQGAADGSPIVYLHGTPGANKDHSRHEAFYQAQGIRLLAVNRPGTGASSYDANWSTQSFADDLKQVLDSLGIARTAVVGFSAGGLHACAFAQRHPAYVSRLGLLASVGPFDIPALGDKRSDAIKMFHGTARDNPAALLEQLAGITTPEGFLALLHSLVAPEDQALLAKPEIAQQFLLSATDVLAQGLEPFITEVAMINSPWGFSVAEIAAETLIWHGRADINIPIACAEYLAGAIPNARASYLEGAGHYFPFAQWEELATALSTD